MEHCMTSPTTTKNQQKCRISRDLGILRRTELFSGSPIEVIRLLAYLAKHAKYQPGDPILLQGDRAKSAYFILSGRVEITTIHREREITLQHLHENSFFGELALLARFDWFFSARAATEVKLLTIDRESFKKILEKYPEKQDKIIEKIIKTRITRFEQQTTYMLDRILSGSDGAETEDQPVFI